MKSPGEFPMAAHEPNKWQKFCATHLHGKFATATLHPNPFMERAVRDPSRKGLGKRKSVQEFAGIP
jgi:hypothetical protein